MPRFLLASLAVLLGALLVTADAQSSSQFSGRNGNPNASTLDGITVEKPVDPPVRRAEAVTRRAEPVRQAAPAAPAPSPQTSGSGAGAALRPGDAFELRMTGMPADDAQMFGGTFTIGGDGFLNIPLAGQIRAAGLTQSQLEKSIEKRLIEEKIFRWPTATINVRNEARFVTVGGNIRAPNRIPWSQDLSLLAAISACGGVGDFGGDKVNLIRNAEVTTFSIKKLKRKPIDDPKLLPGDQLDVL